VWNQLKGHTGFSYNCSCTTRLIFLHAYFRDGSFVSRLEQKQVAATSGPGSVSLTALIYDNVSRRKATLTCWYGSHKYEYVDYVHEWWLAFPFAQKKYVTVWMFGAGLAFCTPTQPSLFCTSTIISSLPQTVTSKFAIPPHPHPRNRGATEICTQNGTVTVIQYAPYLQ
jgi:hypothetical protein